MNNYPKSSFGFVGARTLDTTSNKVEAQFKTQRFRVYKTMVARKIGTKTFAHFEYEEISGYLLVNKASINILDKEAALVHMLVQTYNDLPAID